MTLNAFGLDLSIAHKCRQTEDPRFKGYCACGRKLVKQGLQRTPGFECKLTEEFSQGHDVSDLNRMAGRRADAGALEYGHSFPADDRNLITEAAEELLDARNYVVWALERIHRGIDENDWRTPHLQSALTGIIGVFRDLSEAQG